MTQIAAPRIAAAARQAAATYDGFYLRDNLDDSGAVPAPAPFDLCPDVVRSTAPVADPQSALSTAESWRTMYATDPVLGTTNYYYLRGTNGSAAAVAGELSLYWSPSQLILFPSLWKASMLTTASGAETVPVSAEPGAIGVGADPFVWTDPPALTNGRYYCFVGQANDASNSNPVPAITSWAQMGSLLIRNRGFGFRNACSVARRAGRWSRSLSLTIPANLDAGGVLTVTLRPTGLVGDTVGLSSDTFSTDLEPIVINPTVVSQDGALIGVRFTVEPGFACGLRVQYWNTSGGPPPTGSSLVVEAAYVVPTSELASAAAQGLTPRPSDRRLGEALDIGPTATILVGAANFVVH